MMRRPEAWLAILAIMALFAAAALAPRCPSAGFEIANINLGGCR